MRKNIFLLPIVFGVVNLVSAQSAVYDGNLLGKVKSVRLLIYDEGRNNIHKAWPIGDSMVCYYDENGYEQGKSFLFYFDPHGKITEFLTDEFDSKGKASKQVNYYPDSTVKGNIIYSYDQPGELIMEVGYKSDGTIDYTAVYGYSKGQLIQKETESPDSAFPRLARKVTYQYDAKGNKIEADEYWNGVSHEDILFQYDDKRNNIRSVHHYPDPAYGTDFEIRYQYDDRGNILIESKYQSMGALLSKVTYDYVLDSNKNWKEKTRKEIVGKNKNILSYKKFRRIIEYY